MGLNVKLVVVGGEVKTTELKLRLPSTIGRARGTTIVLPHPLVSRQHCEIFEADGRLRVRDLGSLNGTFINNVRITGDVELPPGELLTIGSVTFRAVYEPIGAGTSEAAAPSTAQDKEGTLESLPVKKAPVETPAPVAAPEEKTLEASGDYSGLLDSGEIPPLDDDNQEVESRPPLFQLASSPVAPSAPAAPLAKPAAVAAKAPAPMATPVAAKPAPVAVPAVAPAAAAPKPDFSALGSDDTVRSSPTNPQAGLPGGWADEEDAAEKDSEEDDFNNFLKNLK